GLLHVTGLLLDVVHRAAHVLHDAVDALHRLVADVLRDGVPDALADGERRLLDVDLARDAELAAEAERDAAAQLVADLPVVDPDLRVARDPGAGPALGRPGDLGDRDRHVLAVRAL